MSIDLKMIQCGKLPANIRYRPSRLNENSKGVIRQYWSAAWSPYPVNIHEIIARLKSQCKTITPTFLGATVYIRFGLLTKHTPEYIISEYFDANCKLQKMSAEYASLGIPCNPDPSVRYWVAKWEPFPATVHDTIVQLQQVCVTVSTAFTSDTAVEIAFSLSRPELGSVLLMRHFDNNCVMIPRVVYTRKPKKISHFSDGST